MQDTIHLEPNQVPATIRGTYKGSKFQAQVTETVTIPSDAGLWSGGSREVYYAVRIADGASADMPGQAAAPWTRGGDRHVTLVPGIAVVCHSMFCGKDMGLRIALHPSDAAPLLPTRTELEPMERAVLEYTCGRKSSYNGRNRCQMLQDDMRSQINYGYGGLKYLSAVPTTEQWEAAKAGLIAKGLLNKAGAVTVAGRNARQS